MFIWVFYEVDNVIRYTKLNARSVVERMIDRIKEIIATNKTIAETLAILPQRVLAQHSKRIAIEITNRCNLRCVLCPTNRTMKRKKGDIGFDEFTQIIDWISPYKKLINVGFAGDPLLNPNVFKMTKYASEHGLYPVLGTNGTLLHKFGVEEVVNSAAYTLSIALDGATSETYNNYRIGGDFDQVLENVRLIVNSKRETGNIYPIINIQFVIMNQNEHEIEKIERLSRDLGADYITYKTMASGLGPSVEQKDIAPNAKNMLPSKKYRRTPFRKRVRICPWMWRGTILWNGDLTICCFDYEGENVVGNVFDYKNIDEIWGSKEFDEMRKRILRNEPHLCKICEIGPNTVFKRVILNTEINLPGNRFI